MPANRLALLANELQIQLQEERDRAGEPIAIIGMAGRYAGGCDTLESFWRMLSEGRDAIEDLPDGRWDLHALYDPDPDAPGKIVTRRGSFLRNFDCFDADFFGVPAREAATMDPQHRLLLEVAWEALEDTGNSPEKRKGTTTGVFIGICTNDYVDILTHSDTPWEGYLAQGTAHSIAAGRLSYVFGFEGPCLAVDTACSSSLIAAHLACRSLQAGECDVALAGGVSVLLSPIVSIDFSRARILSPSGLCRPFDARADGYVRGEGCGILVLKRLSQAVRDGDPIRAVIRGSAMNHGGPYPATGHPGFTAVGIPASLRRFTMLECYDNVRENRLPPALRDKNPSGTMWRLIDGNWTQADVTK
jgi:acyl transferase domain-containing protein